jgi:hypothetical protein
MEIQSILPAFLLSIKQKLTLFIVLLLLGHKFLIKWVGYKPTGIFAPIIRASFIHALMEDIWEDLKLTIC